MSESITNESAKDTKSRLSRRVAIRERCLDCQGRERGGVTLCDFDDDCTLHPFRMGTGKQDPEQRGKAIKTYCLWCMVDDEREVTLCPSSRCSLFPYRKHG
jgi:hypothetical protein